jgi:hypothetical protein
VKDHLGTLIEQHLHWLRGEIRGQKLTVICDASPRFAEAFVVVVRWVTDEFIIRQEIGDFQLFDSPLCGKDYTSLVLNTVEALGSNRKMIVSGATDRASTNGVLASGLEGCIPNYQHSWCMAHVFDGLGKELKCLSLFAFLKVWNKTFSKSPGARGVFYGLAKEAWKRKHKIRWGSTFDQVLQIQRLWASIPRLIALLKMEKVAVKQTLKLAELFESNQSVHSDLSLQVNLYADVVRRFREANLLIQGDGFLAPFANDCLTKILEMFNGISDNRMAQTLPNVAAAISAAPVGQNPAVLWANVRTIINPAYLKFKALFLDCSVDGEAKVSFAKPKLLFRFAQLFHPTFTTRWINRASNRLNIQEQFGVEGVIAVLGELVPGMMDEFPRLLEDYATEMSFGRPAMSPDELQAFWKARRTKFPSWFAGARRFALICPSSCAAERAFSVWRTLIGDLETQALEDRQKYSVQKGYSLVK